VVAFYNKCIIAIMTTNLQITFLRELKLRATESAYPMFQESLHCGNKKKLHATLTWSSSLVGQMSLRKTSFPSLEIPEV